MFRAHEKQRSQRPVHPFTTQPVCSSTPSTRIRTDVRGIGASSRVFQFRQVSSARGINTNPDSLLSHKLPLPEGRLQGCRRYGSRERSRTTEPGAKQEPEPRATQGAVAEKGRTVCTAGVEFHFPTWGTSDSFTNPRHCERSEAISCYGISQLEIASSLRSSQ